MSETITLSFDEIYQLSFKTLTQLGLCESHSQSIAQLLATCQMDDCGSHGIYRLIMCADTIKAGKVSLDATPQIRERAPSIVKVDANKGFSLPAFDAGVDLLIEKTKKQGIASLAINHCFHFTALWPEVERIASQGLVALAMLPSHSWVAPAGGTQPLFGTNPFAFAWPRVNQNPYVFDLATSAASRGDIELHQRQNKPIPLGWGLDSAGQPTTDARQALEGAMCTFGGHKGSAIATMIELMAGPLIGDLMSKESMEFDDGDVAAPYHGELIIALDPSRFIDGEVDEHLWRAENLFNDILAQGARLPSVGRYQAREKNINNGYANIPKYIYEAVSALV